MRINNAEYSEPEVRSMLKAYDDELHRLNKIIKRYESENKKLTMNIEEIGTNYNQQVVLAGYLDQNNKDLTKKLDEVAEMLWQIFGNIPVDPRTKEITKDFMKFPAGTSVIDIWHWFDELHSKGIHYLHYLLYDMNEVE